MSIGVWVAMAFIGGIGAVTRYMVDRSVARRVVRSFPVGTLTVNLTGAALLGFIGGLTISHAAALIAGTAFVGAYTTFSTWMLETQRLGEERQFRTALANVLGSLVLGIAAAAAGQWIATLI